VLVGCRTTEFTWIDRIDRRVLGFGGNFVLYWGYKKKFSSSWCVAGGDRCSSYFGEASVPVCCMPSALVCFEVCLWFTFESVLITQSATCFVRYDHSLGLKFDFHVVLCKFLQSDLFACTRLIFVLETLYLQFVFWHRYLIWN